MHIYRIIIEPDSYYFNIFTLLVKQKQYQQYIIMIDEKVTLKATEHDKYENISGSVWLSLFIAVMKMHNTAHAA
jgi:hypothetical protein